MGIIQNAVNQMLGTVGVAARLSPGYETKQELHKLGKQEEALKARRDAAVESIQKTKAEGNLNLKTMESDANILQETATEVEKLRKRQFELKPSVASYEQYHKSKDIVKQSKEIKQNLLEMKQEAALKKVKEQQEAQKTQKRNFMSYLKQQPTSLGGTIGELPADIQKQIASQYSKTQRKQLMDTMNAQKEKNK